VRSLFAKILGWFVLTTFLTTLGTILVAAFTYDPYSTRPAPFTMLLAVQMGEAQQAWETGGKPALEAALARFRDVTQASRISLTDGDGRDLLTGEQHGELLQKAKTWSRIPFSGQFGTTFTRFSSDGKYCLFLTTGRRNWFFWYLQPAHLLVLALAALLCYALTYHLTAPLRRLRKVVDRFGRGDFETRAEESRRDEFGELAAAFNSMAGRIQTLLAAERRLLLDISHELRSPLARLSVAVELARSGEGRALPLDRIQKEADRLNELIGQLLEVTRIEGDDAHRKNEPVRLDELVGGLVDDCSIEARARGCELEMNSHPVVAMHGDGELLRRAIENVMRNAIRYAPRESKVEVAIENGGGRARVRIRDYGPGVPAEALPRLFDPFYRVDSDRNRNSGGVGLGLSIARRAVELHRGTLRASNASPGLLVEIELPVTSVLPASPSDSIGPRPTAPVVSNHPE
jgi:signal transduction histidine kinase